MSWRTTARSFLRYRVFKSLRENPHLWHNRRLHRTSLCRLHISPHTPGRERQEQK